MGLFLKWSEWKLRESNARKRAVRSALNGTGPSLPGSYAACPGTNTRAMKSAKKNGLVGSDVVAERDQMPDYSFDMWVKKANEFGDDVNKMRSKGKEDEEEIDKKIDDKKKVKDKTEKEPSEHGQDSEDSEVNKRKEEVWKLLRKKRQESVPKEKSDERS